MYAKQNRTIIKRDELTILGRNVVLDTSFLNWGEFGDDSDSYFETVILFGKTEGELCPEEEMLLDGNGNLFTGRRFSTIEDAMSYHNSIRQQACLSDAERDSDVSTFVEWKRSFGGIGRDSLVTLLGRGGTSELSLYVSGSYGNRKQVKADEYTILGRKVHLYLNRCFFVNDDGEPVREGFVVDLYFTPLDGRDVPFLDERKRQGYLHCVYSPSLEDAQEAYDFIRRRYPSDDEVAALVATL